MIFQEKYIYQLGWYIYHTKKEDIIYTPYTSKGLECYVDADYSGGWFQADATSDDYFMSRTVMVVMYANCPVFWCISLQTEISLSKAEA